MHEALTSSRAPLARATRFGTGIAGLGIAVPSTVVDNAAITAHLGLEDPGWIVQRTGIRERRVLAPGETLTALAANAADEALLDARVAATDVDLVLVATCSADDLLPAAAPLVAREIGATGAGATDVGAACTGVLSGLQLGAAAIEAGRADTALVIGAEGLSRMTDRDDKRTAALFADGAGAIVLQRVDAPGDVGPIVLHSEAQRDLLFATRERGVIEMEGHEVFKHAVVRMSEATHEACAEAGTTLDEIDLFVYHQANRRILDAVGRRLGLDPARVVDSIAGYGNTSAASVPLALAHARTDGRLRGGMRVLVSAFGAGFTWGAAVIDWRQTA